MKCYLQNDVSWNNYSYPIVIQKRFADVSGKWEGLWRKKYLKEGCDEMLKWKSRVVISGEGATVNKGMEKEKCVLKKTGVFVINVSE
jgi:hypothetical protein